MRLATHAHWSLLGLIGGLLIAIAPAQTNAPVILPQYRATQTFSWDFGWLSKAWSAQGEAPYAAYRRRVDALGTRSAGGDAAARREIVALAERHLELSVKAPKDPLLLYEHLYAAYMACQRDPRQWSSLGLGEGVERLMRLSPPHTREYARLLFVLDTVPVPHRTMWALGERLLRDDPGDRRVNHLLASRLVPSNSLEEGKAALGWANRLVQRWPDNPRSYTVTGGVYFALYIRFRRGPDGMLAIKEYKEYLKRASSDDPERKSIEGIVAYIEGGLKKNKSTS